MKFIRCAVVLATLTLLTLGAGEASASPFKFGVMSDTQWVDTGVPNCPASPTCNDTTNNPNTVAASIINPLNQKFIDAGVKFVVQVGDLVDVYSSASMAYRASLAQPLYNAGIGFFPLRGNHERDYAAVSDVKNNFPQMTGAGNMFGATNYSAQGPNSLSYSFDYGNARFVLLDQFPTSGSGTRPASNATTISSLQQDWITNTLAGKPAVDGQAFVFSHKNLIGANHTDTLFGANPSVDPTGQTAFINSIADNGVRYYMSGHDHIHQRSLIQAPGSTNTVQQIIGASDSNKFYIPLGNSEAPGTTNNDIKYNNPTRETSISQERNTVGYYIYTVDGPRVTGQFYSAVVNPLITGAGTANAEYNINSTPPLNFTLRETFGYSLNGKEFLIGQGNPYNIVQDSFGLTTAQILDGFNSSTATDGSRPFTQAVDTGWTSRTEVGGGLISDVLSLWGMQKSLESTETNPYVLSLSFDPTGLSNDWLASGNVYLVSKDANGNWVNAVDLNLGGTKNFVVGAYSNSYGLGTYGIDPTNKTAWAVINHASDFGVASVSERSATGALTLLGLTALGLKLKQKKR